MAACVQPVKALKHPTASPCSTAALNTPHRQRPEARAHDVLRLADEVTRSQERSEYYYYYYYYCYYYRCRIV